MNGVELLENPGLAHTAPQGLYRPRFNPVNIAFKKRQHRPTRRHRAAFAAAVSGPPAVTPQQYDSVVCTFAGWQYSQTCDRCGGSCHSFDCSGLQCHVCAILGIGIGCLTSFVMAQLCTDHGLYIPYDQARGTQSHWAFIGADQGRAPLPGDEGHVVDGRGIVNGRAETMEAMGRRWGCLIASWDGRGWDGTYLIPGVNYKPPAPKLSEVDMQVFICPNKPVDGNGNTPHAECWPAGSNAFLPHGGILLRWGASIDGDHSWGSKDDPRQRLLLPAAGATWIGFDRRGTDGLMIVNAAGRTSGAGSLRWS